MLTVTNMKDLRKSNFHTHSTFCDGRNTPEEIVTSAIERFFSSLGFSGLGYTPFDLRYCMTDTEGYISEVIRLKDKYKKDIQIYLGVEEDAFSPLERGRFDYIIGASHYFCVRGEYLPIDSSHAHFQRCLEAFSGNVIALADAYYSSFCAYIKKRRPDIIGHFDLITKFEEMGESHFLGNAEYEGIAKSALLDAASAECIFEINTGAISRGIRSTVYPAENLLHLLKKEGGRIILSSDSHSRDTLDYAFDDTRRYLYDIGFRELYTLYDGKFIPINII